MSWNGVITYAEPMRFPNLSHVGNHSELTVKSIQNLVSQKQLRVHIFEFSCGVILAQDDAYDAFVDANGDYTISALKARLDEVLGTEAASSSSSP
jgi:hypothetical protein